MASNILTPEEVEDTYQTKITKRILMQEHPWIVGFKPFTQEHLDRWNLIFLDFIVDVNMLMDEYGLIPYSYVTQSLNRGNEFHSSYLTVFFENGQGIIDTQITPSLLKIIKSVKSTPAIPENLKLPRNRQFFSIGSWHADVSLWRIK